MSKKQEMIYFILDEFIYELIFRYYVIGGHREIKL